MGLFNNFNISGSAMTANTVRMNLVASNLANINSAASSVEGTYKSRQAVFKTVMDEFSNDPSVARVGIDRIVESDEPLKAQYQPNHPNANDDGYVFMPNVNPVEAMANVLFLRSSVTVLHSNFASTAFFIAVAVRAFGLVCLGLWMIT